MVMAVLMLDVVQRSDRQKTTISRFKVSSRGGMCLNRILCGCNSVHYLLQLTSPTPSPYTMAPKRKREEEKDLDSVFRPPAGTRSYETGQSVKEGLASGSRQGE